MPTNRTGRRTKYEPEPDNFAILENLMDQVNSISCKPGPEFTKVSRGTVIDEEKSVRWNREEVERLRNEYDEEAKRLNRIKNEKYNEAVERIINLISKETGLSKEKAGKLWSYAFYKYHADSDSLFLNLEELCDLYNELKN